MDKFALMPLAIATWETIYMTFVAGILSLGFGLVLGIILFMTQANQPLAHKPLNRLLGFIVNATRSLPFIILLIAVIPLTRFLVGTSIGTNAAIVPLTLAAIPFFARVCENALSEVPVGLIETAHALGATPWQLIQKFLLPESLPALINGGTLTLIGLIGYSAMAGAVGGGGLGELAINYGYERFNIIVMLETVVLLILIVQVIQWLGDVLARHRQLKSAGVTVLGVTILGIILSFLWPSTIVPQQTLKVGVMAGINVDLMKVAKQEAAKQGLTLKIVPFHDYVQPNIALNNGDIDANIFQHLPYLNAQLKQHHYAITPIAKTFVYPFGFYSQKLHHLSQLKSGDTIAIPNDPSNGGRALLLLAKASLITLRPGVGLFPTIHDIVTNPYALKFMAINAAQIPRALPDVTLGGITNDYIKTTGLTPKQALLLEGPDSPYANLLVARIKDKNRPIFKKLITALQSKAFVKATQKAFPDGAAIPAF